MNEDYVKFCPVCNETKENVALYKNNPSFQEFAKGYMYPFYFENAVICPYCKKGTLEEGTLTYKEFHIIDKASNSDRQFLEAMIDLKKKDPIEYQLKFNQFKTQVEQQEAAEQTKKQAEEQARKQEEASKPHCPHCGSTNIAKIDALERAGSVLMLGIFSKKINKSFKCKKCGYTW